MKHFWIIPIYFFCTSHCFGAPLAVSYPPDIPPNYFVATNGTPTGNGRMTNPISMTSLFLSNNIPFKTNGAVFWMRGGTYPTSGGQINMVATGITVRPYPLERVIIRDGIWVPSGSVGNTIQGLNLWCPIAILTESNAYPNGENLTYGFEVLAAGTKTIGNNLVGWNGDGLATWSSASNTLDYGDVVVASGVNYTNPTPSNHGHGLYAQNQDGTKTVALCHFLYACSDVATFHGTSAAYENNINFQSNFVAGSDSMGLISQNVSYDFELNRGDSTADYGVSNVWVTDNMIVQDAGDGPSSSLVIGQEANPPASASATNYAVHFDRNLFRGGFVSLGDYDTFTFSSNLIWSVCSSWAARIVTLSPTLQYAPNSINGTAWYYTGGNDHPWYAWTNLMTNTISIISLAQWQGFVSGDSNATYSTSTPTTVIVKVWPNALRDSYDCWWGDVAIWNPNRISNNVPVVLTGLPAGTKIDVRYTGDILGGSILTTTYDGSGITIPMTNLPTYQPNDPTWPKLPQPTNGASFRVFLTDSQTNATPPILLTGAVKLPNGAFQFAFTNTPVGTNYITTNITTTITTNWSKWGPPKIIGYTTNITPTLTTNRSEDTATVLTTTNLLLPLTNWTVLGTVTDNPPGQFQFTDPQATNHPLRFYRVRSP